MRNQPIEKNMIFDFLYDLIAKNKIITKIKNEIKKLKLNIVVSNF